MHAARGGNFCSGLRHISHSVPAFLETYVLVTSAVLIRRSWRTWRRGRSGTGGSSGASHCLLHIHASAAIISVAIFSASAAIVSVAIFSASTAVVSVTILSASAVTVSVSFAAAVLDTGTSASVVMVAAAA